MPQANDNLVSSHPHFLTFIATCLENISTNHIISPFSLCSLIDKGVRNFVSDKMCIMAFLMLSLLREHG